MARKRFGFKPAHRDVLQQNNAAQKFYARMAGMDPPAELLNSIKPKRERAAPRALEAPVVAAISELLAVHPRVIWAARFNSGAASYEAASGRYAPVWFHRFLRAPEKMRMPDFFGLCKCVEVGDYILPMPIAIEAKAPGWTKPRDDREREQAAFLAMVRSAGGIGIFATSADHVAEALR